MNQQHYSLFGTTFWATPVNQQKLEEETQTRSNELAKQYERILHSIRLAALYTRREIDQPHNSLFGSSHLATPTQTLEQETRIRSEELAKEYESRLSQYDNFIQRRFFLQQQ